MSIRLTDIPFIECDWGDWWYEWKRRSIWLPQCPCCNGKGAAFMPITAAGEGVWEDCDYCADEGVVGWFQWLGWLWETKCDQQYHWWRLGRHFRY